MDPVRFYYRKVLVTSNLSVDCHRETTRALLLNGGLPHQGALKMKRITLAAAIAFLSILTPATRPSGRYTPQDDGR
jgi:hypothetical protein